MNVLRIITVAVLFMTAAPRAARAQSSADSLAFLRAQRLLNDGDSTASRLLLDSLVASTRAGTAARADALYWRASSASDPAAAKRDFLTIALDYALFPRAADALLALGRNALSAGDRQTAIVHLERLVLEHPVSNAAGDGWLTLGRARVDEGNLPLGCAAFDSAQRHLAAGDVERRRQVQFAAQSCRSLPAPVPASSTSGATPPPPPASDTRRDSARNDSSQGAAGKTPRADTAVRATRWSAQVAAYKLRTDAERLAQSLKARGFDARVDASTLFRVRVGVFRARADAVAMVAKLKVQKIEAIVVEAAPRGS